MRSHRRVAELCCRWCSTAQNATDGGDGIPSNVILLASMEYSALDTDANEIRLLTLLPDDENGRVCCTLMHVSLINPPEYVALSYCWGDQAITREITINGVQVQITTNLESALRHLFCHYKCLWVDAICINQQDKAERSQRRCWGDPKCLFQTLLLRPCPLPKQS
jgi:hypothetical protein